ASLLVGDVAAECAAARVQQRDDRAGNRQAARALADRAANFLGVEAVRRDPGQRESQRERDEWATHELPRGIRPPADAWRATARRAGPPPPSSENAAARARRLAPRPDRARPARAARPASRRPSRFLRADRPPRRTARASSAR